MAAKGEWTARRRKAVCDHIALLAPKLRLADWTITCDFTKESDEGSVAQIDRTPHSKHATICFGPDFLELAAAEQHQTLVHELVHCHLFGMHCLAEESLNLLPTAAKKLSLALLTAQVEEATDALADALAPLLPPLKLD